MEIILIKGSNPPDFNIISLYTAQSPAIFPRAQSACSAISLWGDLNNWTNKGIPPLSIIVWVWWEVPDAILVKAQAASSYRWTCSYYLINSMNLGTILLSMTYWIGGPSSTDKIFLNPITP